MSSHDKIVEEFKSRLEGNSLWFLNHIAPKYQGEFGRFAYDDPGDGRFFIRNGYFEAVDAEVLYSIVRWLNPKRIIEIGAGYSTMVMREAISDNRSDCQILSIDPAPRRDIGKFSDNPIRLNVEFISPKLFKLLEPHDILFVDSSHSGEDVDFILGEVLDALGPEVYVHFHDIYFPRDYPEVCLKSGYDEQYKLVEFLIRRSQQWDLIFGGSLSQLKFNSLLCQLFPNHKVQPDRPPGSLWLKKISEKDHS